MIPSTSSATSLTINHLSLAVNAQRTSVNDYFTRHGDKARAVLEAFLEKYSDEGLLELENLDVLKVQPFNEIGTPIQIVQSFGGATNISKRSESWKNNSTSLPNPYIP